MRTSGLWGGGGFREGKKMLVEEKRKDNENFPSLS